MISCILSRAQLKTEGILATSYKLAASWGDWVLSAMVGIKQKYPIYRQLKGNAQIMYNISTKITAARTLTESISASALSLR